MLTQSLSSQSRLSSHRKPFVSRKSVNVSSRGKLVVVASNIRNSSSSCSQISRRDLAVSLAGSLGAAQLLSAFPAAAEGESAAQQYNDPEDAFKLVLPTNWQSSEVWLMLARGLLDSCRTLMKASSCLNDTVNADQGTGHSWHAHIVSVAYQHGCLTCCLYPPAPYHCSCQGLLDGNKSFTGSSGARRTIAWYPTDVPADQVNVSLTITNTSEQQGLTVTAAALNGFGTHAVGLCSCNRAPLGRCTADSKAGCVAACVDSGHGSGGRHSHFKPAVSVVTAPGCHTSHTAASPLCPAVCQLTLLSRCHPLSCRVCRC
jgi:hypothetical protein